MYQIKIHRQVAKKLQKLPTKDYQKISKELHQLSQKGKTSKTKKLSGKHKGSYRLRIGDWRILFTKDDEKKTICLLHLGPRGDIY